MMTLFVFLAGGVAGAIPGVLTTAFAVMSSRHDCEAGEVEYNREVLGQ